jgi:membrane-associated phospholipid phosphatase
MTKTEVEIERTYSFFDADSPSMDSSLKAFLRQDAHFSAVLHNMYYSTILFGATFGIVGLIVHLTAKPVTRFYLPTDPTISYNENPDTIPFWLVGLFTFVCIAFIAYVELVYKRLQHVVLSRAIWGTVYWSFDLLAAACITFLVTEATKYGVGRLRPDFLSRCLADPAIDPLKCTNTNTAEVQDGHLSFPSGHSSHAFLLSTYMTYYLIQALYFGAPRCPLTSISLSRFGCFLHEAKEAVKLFLVLMPSGLAFGTGVTRITDNRHNVSDVLGGRFCWCGCRVGVCGASKHDFLSLPSEAGQFAGVL